MSPQWMINRGGRFSADMIHYRIGTGEFGRNLWRFRPWDEIKIYEKYPSYRVALQASVLSLKKTRLEGFNTIHKSPNADKRIFSM